MTLTDLKKRLKAGATGRYPHGSIGRHDEGELQLALSHDNYGNIRIEFGKPVAWMAFPKHQGIELAKLLLKYAGAKRVEIEF